jgi:hypothetical protein
MVYTLIAHAERLCPIALGAFLLGSFSFSTVYCGKLKSKIEVLVGYWSRAIAIGGRGHRALTHIRLRRSASDWLPQ